MILRESPWLGRRGSARRFRKEARVTESCSGVEARMVPATPEKQSRSSSDSFNSECRRWRGGSLVGTVPRRYPGIELITLAGSRRSTLYCRVSGAPCSVVPLWQLRGRPWRPWRVDQLICPPCNCPADPVPLVFLCMYRLTVRRALYIGLITREGLY